jgi:hypothetical protein
MSIKSANMKTAIALATKDVNNIPAQTAFAATYLDRGQSKKFLAVCQSIRECRLPASGPVVENAIKEVFTNA